jgi:hypothetical protein
VQVDCGHAVPAFRLRTLLGFWVYSLMPPFDTADAADLVSNEQLRI